jgi:hypothetical protein
MGTALPVGVAHMQKLAHHVGQRNRDACAFSQKKEDETPADASVIFVVCKVLNKPQLGGCAVKEQQHRRAAVAGRLEVSWSTNHTVYTSYKIK